jgi:hypothetical protein
MLDFTPVRNKEMTWTEFTAVLSKTDLQDSTNEMVDQMLDLIAECTDEDVSFEPDDPEAYDTFALDKAEVSMPWTLGHVIVHTTASAEESAAIAAELARGVAVERRRSRSELPWRQVTTIAQCRERLEESRRMRLASLEMWPDKPYLDNYYQYKEGGMEITAVIRFVVGLAPDDSHRGQISDIVQQAKGRG